MIEDAVYVKGSQTLYDPPEYAPAKMYDFLEEFQFPDDVDISSMSNGELENWIKDNKDSIDFSWRPYDED